MSTSIHWILSLSIKPNQYTAFKAVMNDMVTATKNEEGTLAYEWFVDEASELCHISERFVDSDAALKHLSGFEPYAERFFDALEVQHLSVYGSPSVELKDALNDLGPTYLSLNEGFVR